jgi:hypothetical protein
MNRSTHIKNAILILLISLNAVVLIAMNNRSKRANQPTNEDVSYSVKSLLASIDLAYKSEAMQPDIGTYIDSIFLLHLNRSPILCLRISQKHCEICTFEALADFKSYGALIPLVKIVFTDFNEPMSVSAFKSSNKDFIVLDLKSLGLKAEEASNPFIFLLDTDMKTNMIFVHQKEFPEKTKNYFEAVTRLVELQ